MPMHIGKIQSNYEGSIDANKMRIGYGVEKFSYHNEQETYNGRFFRDSYHGQGFYYTKPARGSAWSYEGAFYANTKDGIGMISYGNNTYFIGLFRNDEAFGPGIWTESNGGQNIGFWKGSSLIRLIYPVGEVKQLSTTPYNKYRVLRYRRVINGNPDVRDYAAETIEQFHASPNVMLISDRLQAMYCKNPQSHLFMKKQFDDVYMDDLIPAEVLFTLIRSVSVNTIDELREKLDEFAAPVSEESIVDRQLSDVTKKKKKPDKKGKKGRKDSLLSISQSDVDLTPTAALSKSQILKRDTSLQDMESKTMVTPAVSKASLFVLKPKLEGTMNLDDLSESQSTLYLMAWNNSQIMVDMLMHAFTNRNAKSPIPMNFGLIMCGRREKFSSKKGYLEVLSKKFLKACSSGNIDVIKELAYTWRVDVNLSDSKGNSCLLRAVEADNHPLIKLLILYGADPDILNDEGFSTITHCLTRYLAIKRKITNWGDAFLPPADFVPNANVQQWMFDGKNAVDMKSGPTGNVSNRKVRASMTEEYIFDFTPPTPIDPWSEIFHMMDKKQTKTAKKQKREKKDLKKINKKLLYNQEILDDSESAISGGKFRRSTRMSLDMTPDEIIENKLATIEKTIQLLTNVGGDLNVSEVPAPAILLAILTGMNEIVEVLLEQGVDPNARLLKEQKSGNLTPMHVMVLSPPLQTYPDILKLLLKYGGNANLLTSENFDMAAQEFLLGKLDRSLFEPVRGMTPIQALCLRVDVERQQDILPILEEMLKILIPASVDSFRPSHRYLDHTPLSLAIARGSSQFVKILLEAKEMVDPNEYLGTHMGNALAVLMRYLGTSPLLSIYQMLNYLLKEGANPLRKIHLEDGNVGNLFDFLKNFQTAMIEDFFEEMNKQGPSEVKKDVSPKKQKKKKKKEIEGKPKVPMLSKEFQVKHAEYQCKMAILENMCRAKIDRRIRGRLLKELLLKIQNMYGSLESHTALLVERMRLWFTPDSFVNTIKEGVALGNFCLSKADVDVALSILFPVVIKRHKQLRKDIKTLKKLEKQQRQMKMGVFTQLENIFQYCKELKGDFVDTELKMRKKYNVRLISRNTDLYPELDPSEDLYKVCYNCLQRNRPLEVCPRCGLVYFCSEFCNMLDVAREDPTGHNCGIRFYGVTKPEHLNLASIGLLRGKIYDDFRGSPWARDKIDINTLMEDRDHESFLVDRAEYFDRFAEQEERRRIIMAEKEEQRQAYEKELEAIRAKLLAEEEAERRRLEKEKEQQLRKEEEMKEAELKKQQDKQRKEMEEEDKKEERERAIQQMLSYSQAKKEGLTDILEGIKEHSLGELQTLSDKLLELRGEMSDEKLDELLLLSLLEGTGTPEEDKAKETDQAKVSKDEEVSEKEADKSIGDKERALKKKDTEKTKKEKEAKKEKDKQEQEKYELEKREKELARARRERRDKERAKKEKERREKFAEKAKKEKEKRQQELEKAKKDRIKQLEKLAKHKSKIDQESKEKIEQPKEDKPEDEDLEKVKKEKEKLEEELKKIKEQEALKDIAQLEKEAMQEVKEHEKEDREKREHILADKKKDVKEAKEKEEKEKRARLQIPPKPPIEKEVAKATKEQPKIAMKPKEGLAKAPPPKVQEQIPKKPVIITDKGEVKPPEISHEVKAVTDYKVDADKVIAEEPTKRVVPAKPIAKLKPRAIVPVSKTPPEVLKVKEVQPQEMIEKTEPVLSEALAAEPEPSEPSREPEPAGKPIAKPKPRAIVPVPKTPPEVLKVKEVQPQEMIEKTEPVLSEALAAEPEPSELSREPEPAILEKRSVAVTPEPEPIKSEALYAEPTPAPEVVEPPREAELQAEEISLKPAEAPPEVLPSEPSPTMQVVQPPGKELKAKPRPGPPKAIRTKPAPKPKVVEPIKGEVRPQELAHVPPETLLPEPVPKLKIAKPAEEELKLTPEGKAPEPSAPLPPTVLPTEQPPKFKEEPSREEAKPPEISVKPAPVPPKVLPPTPAPVSKVVEPPREEIMPRPPEVTEKPAPVPPKVLPPTPAPVPKVVGPPRKEVKPRPPEVSVKPTPVPSKVLPPTPAPVTEGVEPPIEEVKARPPEVSEKPAPVPPKVLPPTPAPVPKVLEPPKEEVKPRPPEVTVKPAPVPPKVLPPSPVPPKVLPPTPAPVPKVLEPPREEVKPRPPEVTVKPAPVPPKVLPPTPAPVPKVVEPPREEVKPSPPEVTVKPAPAPPKVLPPTPAPVPKVVEPPREEVKPSPPEVTVKPAPAPPKVLPPTPAPVPKVVEPPREEVKPRPPEVTVKPAPVPPKVLPPAPVPPKVLPPAPVPPKVLPPAPVPPKVLPPTPAPVPKVVEPPREEIKPSPSEVTVKPAPVPPKVLPPAPVPPKVLPPAPVPPKVLPPTPAPVPKVVEPPREEVKPSPPEVTVKPAPVPPKVLPPTPAPVPKVVEPPRVEVKPRPAPVPPKVLPPTPVPVPKVVEPPREEVKPSPPEVTVKPVPVPPKVLPPAPVPPKVLPPSPAPVPKVVEPPSVEVKPRPPEVTVKPAPVPPKVLPPTPAPVPKVVEPPRVEVKPRPPEVTVKPAPVPPKVLPPTPAPVSKVVEPPREELKPRPPEVSVKPAPVPPKVLPPTPALVPKVVEPPIEVVKPRLPEVTVKPAPVPPKVFPPTPAPVPRMVEPPIEEIKRRPPDVSVKPVPVPPKVLPSPPAPAPKVVEPPIEEVKPRLPEVTEKPAPAPPKVWPPEPAPMPEVWPKVVKPPLEEVKIRPYEIRPPVTPEVTPPALASKPGIIGPEDGVLEYLKQRAMKAKQLPRYPVPKDRGPGVPLTKVPDDLRRKPLSEIEIAGEPEVPFEKVIRTKPIVIEPAEAEPISGARRPLKRRWEEVDKAAKLEIPTEVMPDTALPFAYEPEAGITAEDLRRRLRLEKDIEGGYIIPVEGQELEVGKKIVKPLAGFIYRPIETYTIDYGEPKVKRARPSKKEKVMQEDFGRRPPFFHKFVSAIHPNVRYKIGKGYGVQYMINRLTGKPHRFIAWDELEKHFPEDIENLQGWAHIATEPPSVPERVAEEEFIPPYKEPSYEPFASFRFDRRGQFTWSKPPSVIKEEDMSNVPLHIQELMFKMASLLGPDADLGFLFPFVVIRNGELFYKFYGDKTIIENYSLN